MKKKASEIPQIPRIVFCEVVLPPLAHLIDVTTSLQGIRVEDVTATWFFHFCMCVGITKEAPAKEVLEQVASLNNAIQDASELATSELRRNMPWFEPLRILSEWRETLAMMEREAHRNAVCVWRGYLDKDDDSPNTRHKY